ncbi:MAG: DUF4231 domain-containing protein [Acidobacteria bacterium]|nr:DUF4231 domain-containing protein [Acidobacteriota bacterium]
MEIGDYPSLFAAADTAANKAKRKYYLLLGVQLSIFVLTFFAATLSSKGNGFFSRVSAFLLGASLIISWISRAQHYDKSWYESRSIAEAVKTLTWRYMMQAEPFLIGHDSVAAQKAFASELQQIRRAHARAADELTDFASSPVVFSPHIEEVRNAEWQSRKQEYISRRLEPERIWYESNARNSSSESERWLWPVIISQVLALFFAVVQPPLRMREFNPVSFLMMIASTITAWGQAKRHDEAAHSYASVARTLGELQSVADIEARDTMSLADFVSTVEQVIAKERTAWQIKRSVAIDIDPDRP